MARWEAHRATFICRADGYQTRARRYVAFDGKAPLCPTCRQPTEIKDVQGLSPPALVRLSEARSRQAAALFHNSASEA